MIERTDIINKLFNDYNLKSYLEIGVRVPSENFNKINAQTKIGVDPKPIGECTHKMTSDEYFKNHVNDKTFDVVFVDGLHTEEQVYKDVMNSIKHLNEDGFIVMHDCNPPTEYHIRPYEEYAKTGGQWNGTVFRGFIKLRKELLDWNCFVINEDFGCGVITKKILKGDFKGVDYIPEEISWEYFEKNRKELLNLITFEEYIDLI